MQTLNKVPVGTVDLVVTLPERKPAKFLPKEFRRRSSFDAHVALTTTTQREPWVELLLIYLLASRQMANLKQHPSGERLAYLLTELPDKLEELRGQSNFSGLLLHGSFLLKFGIGDLQTELDETASKQFRAKLVIGVSQPQFYMKPKGFGLFGRGIDRPAIVSVMATALHLVNGRPESDEFLVDMCSGLGYCAAQFLGGELTVMSQVDVAIQALHSVGDMGS